MPDIPPDVTARCDRAHAEANERLDLILDNIRQTIDLRVKTYGDVDDSLHYIALRDFIMGRIALDGSLVTATVLSAALFKLARAPRATDSLEQLMRDKGSEQK